MSVRQIAVYVLLSITALLIPLIVLAPLPAHAQSRPADQLHIPIVTHIGSYSTDLTVTNFTADKVSISVLFLPNNGPVNPNGWRLNALALDPRESRTVEIGTLGIAGQGQLIIDACKAGAFCSPSIDPASDPQTPRYKENTSAMRAISASVRIYSSNGIGTRGDAITATLWYMLPGADLSNVGMDRVQITGIRSDARYGTQIGLVNGSQFSATFLTAILFDGAGVERGRWAERLGPLESVKRGAEQMFPALATNRLNRQPSIAGAWIRVRQDAAIPTEQAASMAGCENGCPRFDAYASVTDSVSGDFSIRLAEYETVNQSSEIAAARTDAPTRQASEATVAHARVRTASAVMSKRLSGGVGTEIRPATSEVCIVDAATYLVWKPKALEPREMEIWMRIAPGELETARAMCGGMVGR